MALDFFTSFDGYSGISDTLTGPTPLFAGEGFAGVNDYAARNGARGYNCAAGSSYAYTPILAQGNQATRICGFALNGPTLTSWNGYGIVGLSDGEGSTAANVQVSLVITTAGAISAYRGRALQSASGGTLLGTSADGVIQVATWQYIEMLATIDPSAGVVTVWVDGTQVLNLTSQNTRSTANSYSNRLVLGGSASSLTYVDDLYCITNSGAAPNARTGDSIMRSIYPSTGNGTHTDFTPSTGTDHGALVDESPTNTTDYNSCATPGDEDSYNYPTLGSVGTIQALNVLSYQSKSVAGTCTMRNLTRISSADYYGTTRDVSTTWTHHVDAFAASPATATTWTEAEINGAEFGVERVA